jgi:tetratricopeptide (TPR) repeat protein
MEKQSAGHWWRTLRPFFWWVLIVLVLYGIRTHQCWMEKTRLNFTATLAGQTPFTEATATFDGQPIFCGQKIPLGQHQFAITHPKGESYATNLFIWYGAHNLGTIDLKRTMSVLSVTANPPAPVLSIHGPELDVELTNSPGLTSSVPTDRYVILSRYAHWSRSDDVLVSPGVPAAWRIAPRLGAAHITCNEADTAGQLIQADGQIVEAVTFPYAISELPEGTYKVTAQHHNDVLSRTVTITADTTNQLSLDFFYGTAVLETEPPGAMVRTGDGRYWGVTPLKVIELKPGVWTFVLQHNGYEAATASLTITADQSTSFHTNLVSVNYTGSMKAARQALDSEDYDGALKAVGEAIIAKPDDAEALTLQRNATGLGLIQHAKILGQQGDYIGGGKELTRALQTLPDNAEARRLLADYRRQEPEQIARQRQERLDQPRKRFNLLGDDYQDSKSFDEHDFKSKISAVQVASGIAGALLSTQPPFVINRNDSPTPDIYLVVATQKFSNGFLSGGERKCLIIVGQTKDDESQILFKVLEYQRHRSLDTSVPITQLPISEKLIPLTSARFPEMTAKVQAQLQAGVSNVTAIIQGVVGQVPTTAVQPAVSP